MPKFFDRELEDKRIVRLNENLFFLLHRRMILWIMNTGEGRDFFGIERSFPKIHEVGTNFFRNNRLMPAGRGMLKRVSSSVFYPGCKFPDVIRYRWEAWLDLVAEYHVYLGLGRLSREYAPPAAVMNGKVMAMLCSTETFYPDKDPETTTVDGYIRYQAAGTWAAAQGALAGLDAGPSTSVFEIAQIKSGAAPNWIEFVRAAFLFDTSSIPDDDSVDTARLSLFGGAVGTDQFLQNIRVVTSSPASNTDLVADDYDQFGSASLANEIDIFNGFFNGAYNHFDFNAAGKAVISKTAITKLGTRCSGDADNVEPTYTPNWVSMARCYFRDQGEPAKDPKLAVTHSTGAAAAGSSVLMRL